jgi:sensor histidine kinase YesM
MEGDKLELIRAVINAENISSESGLRNIQKRLRLLYGEDYGLQIDST